MKQGKCFTPMFQSCDEFSALWKQDVLFSTLVVDDSIHNILSQARRRVWNLRQIWLHMTKWVDCFNNTHYRPEWIKVMKEIELSMGYVLMTGTSGTHIKLTHWSPEHLLSSSLLFAWLKKTRKKKQKNWRCTCHFVACQEWRMYSSLWQSVTF